MRENDHPPKVFISYSHADKMHLERLQKHLAPLERQFDIETWTDRRLIAGDALDEEIQVRLSDSDIVIFLVSADFLSSQYCYEKEFLITLERLESNHVEFVPAIVEPCDWKNTPFGDRLSFPEDGVAVSEYPNPENGYLSIVHATRACVRRQQVVANDLNSADNSDRRYSFAEQCVHWLTDTEVIFHHRSKGEISLDDLFVFPDLDKLTESEEIDQRQSSQILSDINALSDKTLIMGQEQSGKTALIKVLVRNWHAQGAIPVYLSGSSLRSTDAASDIDRAVKSQYSAAGGNYPDRKKDASIVIIDDYDDVRIHEKYHTKLFSFLAATFDKIVLVGDTSIKYHDPELLSFAGWSRYEIRDLGYARRGELIDNWVSLGKDETTDPRTIEMEQDHLTQHVDNVIRKNIVPARPFHVLTILQTLETQRPGEYSLTSYGHCYQALIQSALSRVAIPALELDAYINYLANLSKYMFECGAEFIDESQLAKFQEQYSSQYVIQSHKKVVEKLSEAGILIWVKSRIGFSYRYIYYFYLAKYLADHSARPEIFEKIRDLCAAMHTDHNANVLIFITHHATRIELIDEILINVLGIFPDAPLANLTADELSHVQEVVNDIPDIVLESRDTDEERRKKREVRDDLEELVEDEGDNLNENELLADINRSSRAVEILGQIARNRYGSLEKHRLKQIIQEALDVGRRFLGFYLHETRRYRGEIVRMLHSELRKRKVTDDPKDLQREAVKIFNIWSFATAYGVVRKLAVTTGSDKLTGILNGIAEDSDSPSVELVARIAQMEFGGGIPHEELAGLYSQADGNIVLRRLIRQLVVDHIYLHHVSYDEKQWIANKLEIPIQAQLRIESGRYG